MPEPTIDPHMAAYRRVAGVPPSGDVAVEIPQKKAMARRVWVVWTTWQALLHMRAAKVPDKTNSRSPPLNHQKLPILAGKSIFTAVIHMNHMSKALVGIDYSSFPTSGARGRKKPRLFSLPNSRKTLIVSKSCEMTVWTLGA